MVSEKLQNGWNEWSKYVLKELERLNENIEGLGEKIDKTQDTKQVVDDIKEWKEKIEETVTINDLKAMKKGVSESKTFRTQVVTAIVIVQSIFLVIIALLKLFL